MNFCHPQHTGRKLAHHHTSYLGLSVLLVIVGFALGASTLTASASVQSDSGSMQITANVGGGAAPSTSPTLLQPSPNQTFTTHPITVSGDCIAGLTIEIRKNNYLAGSVRCSDNGSYTLRIDLLVGQNSLIARQFNEFGGSPQSNVVKVTYRPLAKAPTPQTQLILQSDTSSQSSSVGEELSWTLQILGGDGPYALSWDWGDGTVDLKSTEKTGPYTFAHTYSKSGSYLVNITATDKNGQEALLQLSEYTPNTVTPATTKHDEHPGLLLTLWPLYGLLIALVWTFYIGEKFGEYRERAHPHLGH